MVIFSIFHYSQVVLAAVTQNRDALNHMNEALFDDMPFVIQCAAANRVSSRLLLRSLSAHSRLSFFFSFLFEYILIKGVNDSQVHTEQLAAFIHPLPVRLNLIPCNPVPGLGFESPSDEQMNQFSQHLVNQGVFVIRRWSKGRSVSAGCGQLGRSGCLDI